MPKPYKVKDNFFIKAKKEGYRARSAYKLKDIQNRFRLVQRGDHVVDLGAAPGSFMQVLGELVGEHGKVVGFDLQEIEPFDRMGMWGFQADIRDFARVKAALELVKFGKVDVVTSDLAPKTMGVRDIDQWHSVELTQEALKLVLEILKPGGHFVAKVFEGEDLPGLMSAVRKHFKTVKKFKPRACRDRSFETYIVAMGRLS